MVRIQIKSNVLSVLIWVETVCKDYQQMTKPPLADKSSEKLYVQVDLDF